MTRQELAREINHILAEYDYRLDGIEKEALCKAIEALQQDEIIRCEDCKHHGTNNCPMWENDTTEDYMWCCDGERMESDENGND